MVSVNLSKMLKPDISYEAMATCNTIDTWSNMMLRAGIR